jgi:hypothetical protein
LAKNKPLGIQGFVSIAKLGGAARIRTGGGGFADLSSH